MASNGVTNGTDGVNGQGASALVSSASEFTSQEYDYVIVGGGTAGLVLAARLTKNPKVTVAVVEAGKSRLDDMLVNIPALFSKLLWNPEYDWMLSSIPQVIPLKQSQYQYPNSVIETQRQPCSFPPTR
jgi:choline dehydrogenase-like flavoprotein